MSVIPFWTVYLSRRSRERAPIAPLPPDTRRGALTDKPPPTIAPPKPLNYTTIKWGPS